MNNKPKISVLLPTRNRFDKLIVSVESLLSNLDDVTNVEVLIAMDDDDDKTYNDVVSHYKNNELVKVFSYPRHSWKNLNKYIQKLFEETSPTSKWILLWSDDSEMLTKHWDAEVIRHRNDMVLGLQHKQIQYQGLLFFIVPKWLVEPSNILFTNYCDSWGQSVFLSTNVLEYINIQTSHHRDEDTYIKDELYHEVTNQYDNAGFFETHLVKKRIESHYAIKDAKMKSTEKKRILYITPHLSTGGLPQYQYRLIKETSNDFDVYCIEYSIHALSYNVQRNKIIEHLIEGNVDAFDEKNKFYTLHGEEEDRSKKLKKLLFQINPDVVHLQEMPEYFMSNECCSIVYNSDRKYTVIETSHDSSFDYNNKRWYPDKFVVVSDYQRDMLSPLNIPTEVVYYPIDYKTRPNRETALKSLGLDPTIKHVLNVGLFTPRKNQKEVIEYAKRLKDYPIQFHFVGNQADNFKDYWEPLMGDLPENCKVWGERHDADAFYGAMDLFLFTSRGHDSDKETSPIVIREAVGWNIPSMIFPLSVYKGMYDEYESVSYMDFDDTNKNINMILKTLDLQDGVNKRVTNTMREIKTPHIVHGDVNKIELMTNKQAFIISTYINSEATRNATFDCVKALKRFNRPIILCSHSAVPSEISDLVDVCIIDNHNPLMEHSYYTTYLNDNENLKIELNLTRMKKANQSLTVQTNYYNGVEFAKSLGIEEVVCMNYDLIVDDKDGHVIEEIFDELTIYDAWFMEFNEGSFKLLKTVFFACGVDWFLDTFPNVRTPDEYNELCSNMGCENFIENFYHTMVVNNKSLTKKIDHSDLMIRQNTNEEMLFPNSMVNLRSFAEYITLVPIKNSDNYALFVNIPNVVESRVIYVVEQVDDVVGETTLDRLEIKENHTSLTIISSDKPKTVVVRQTDKTYTFEDIVFRLDDDHRQEYELNGSIELKNDELYERLVHSEKYKSTVTSAPFPISVLHLQTNDSRVVDKEKKSRESVRGIESFGLKYSLITNKVYTEKPPIENCARPQYVTDGKATSVDDYKHGESYLTPAHYGCFLSFQNAILNHWPENDFLLLLEGDCLVETTVREFVNTVFKVCNVMIKNDIGYFSFGDTKTLDKGWKQSPVIEPIRGVDWAFITNHTIGIQSIIFSPTVRVEVQKAFRENPWLEADAFMNGLLNENNIKMGILNKRVTSQVDGHSLLDGDDKTFLKQ